MQTAVLTAKIRVFSDIHLNADTGETSGLVLLDLSSAFDDVDHKNLDRLKDWVGSSRPVLSWFRSYLGGRSFIVNMGQSKSQFP